MDIGNVTNLLVLIILLRASAGISIDMTTPNTLEEDHPNYVARLREF
jgi:hypothetical protein